MLYVYSLPKSVGKGVCFSINAKTKTHDQQEVKKNENKKVGSQYDQVKKRSYKARQMKDERKSASRWRLK